MNQKYIVQACYYFFFSKTFEANKKHKDLLFKTF